MYPSRVCMEGEEQVDKIDKSWEVAIGVKLLPCRGKSPV